VKLIAHRGLVNGPDKKSENQPDVIQSALSAGFDCEVDLWVTDSQLYLGHDEPQYKITTEFIVTSGLWIHAKNLDALSWLTTSAYSTSMNYFWHQEDDYVITSHGHIWAYPGKETNSQCVIVMPELQDPTLVSVTGAVCYGICSDYVNEIRRHLSLK
jgi:hypothetical protein